MEADDLLDEFRRLCVHQRQLRSHEHDTGNDPETPTDVNLASGTLGHATRQLAIKLYVKGAELERIGAFGKGTRCCME